MGKDLDFNIQLFAEEGTPSDAGNTPAEQPVADSPEATPDAGSQVEDFDWKVDPNGDVTIDPTAFGFKDSDDPQKEQTEEPKEEEPKEEEQKFKVKINGVETEVTLEELRNGYMKEADYRQKTQMLADDRRKFEEAVKQAQQQQVPQPNVQQPEQPKVDPKEYYKQLSQYATKRVEENLGETFDEYNPIHQAALADEIATFKAQVYERNAGQQRMKAVYNKYSQDPNFGDIDRYAAQRLQQLPYQQAMQIQQALKGNNSEVLDAFYNAVRDEYYRGRGYKPANEVEEVIDKAPVTPPVTPPVKPPFVESAGAEKPKQEVKTNIDYSKLGRLTLAQQAEVARKLGLG